MVAVWLLLPFYKLFPLLFFLLKKMGLYLMDNV